MSCDHTTVGWEHFTQYVNALRARNTLVVVELSRETYKRGADQDVCHICYRGVKPEQCPCCRQECKHWQRFRTGYFVDPKSGRMMVIEEYLAVRDFDCDGTSVVTIAVYPRGKRPRLRTLELPT